MSVHNSDGGDDYVEDPVTLISKLDMSDPLHLHPNDSTALTIVGKNKTGFIDGSCRRFNTYEVLGKQWDRHNQLMKLMQFLMGLDDSYRSSILSREVLPDVRSAYATISSEESHKVASGSIVGSCKRNQTSVSSYFLFL
ncbi:hypothetical protein Tco_0109888 [Tanacetum coccineum]